MFNEVKAWWVVVAVHLVAVVWFISTMAVIGAIETFGGK